MKFQLSLMILTLTSPLAFGASDHNAHPAPQRVSNAYPQAPSKDLSLADTMKTNESLFVRFHQSLVIPAGTGSETVAFVNGKRVLSPNGDEYLEGLKIGDKYCHFDIVKGESARVFAKGEYIRSKSSMMGAKSSDPRYYEFNLKDSDANLATMECAVVKSFNSEAGMVAREATLNEAQSALGDALSIN